MTMTRSGWLNWMNYVCANINWDVKVIELGVKLWIVFIHVGHPWIDEFNRLEVQFMMASINEKDNDYEFVKIDFKEVWITWLWFIALCVGKMN